MKKSTKIKLLKKYFLDKLGPGVQIATLGSIFLLATGFFKDFVANQWVFLSLYLASMFILFSSVIYFLDVIILEHIEKADKYSDAAKGAYVILFLMGLIYFILANIYLGVVGWITFFGAVK